MPPFLFTTLLFLSSYVHIYPWEIILFVSSFLSHHADVGLPLQRGSSLSSLPSSSPPYPSTYRTHHFKLEKNKISCRSFLSFLSLSLFLFWFFVLLRNKKNFSDMKKTNIKLLDFPLVHLFRCLRSEYCLPFFSSSRYVSFPFPVSYLSYLSCFFLCPSTDTQKVDIFTYVLFQI